MRGYNIKQYNYTELANISSCIRSLNAQGLSLLTTFDLLDDLPISTRYKASLKQVRNSIANGLSLEESFKKNRNLYPDFFIQTIALGEEYGRLNDVLEQIEKIYLKLDFIRKKVTSSMIYPVLIMTTLLIATVFLVLYGIPIFHNIYLSMNSSVPDICEKLNDLSTFIKSSPLVVIIGAGCYIIAIPYLIFKIGGSNLVKRILLKANIVRRYYEYISLLYLLLIFKSGVSITSGLELCIDNIDNKNVKNMFLMVLNDIHSGNTLYESIFKSDIFSKYSKALIKIGEESGNLDGRLEFACNHVEIYLFESIDKKIKGLQPLTVIIMGGLVGAFVVFIVLPLFTSIYGGVH